MGRLAQVTKKHRHRLQISQTILLLVSDGKTLWFVRIYFGMKSGTKRLGRIGQQMFSLFLMKLTLCAQICKLYVLYKRGFISVYYTLEDLNEQFNEVIKKNYSFDHKYRQRTLFFPIQTIFCLLHRNKTKTKFTIHPRHPVHQ